jgi:hypothetical protein
MSNGTSLYWGAAGAGSITQVNTGVGMTGGPITASGTVSVLANNGITANSTGTFVTAGNNITVNSTGVHVSTAFIQNTYTGTLSGVLAFSGNTSFSGANNFVSTLFAVGANAVINTTSVSVGNSTIFSRALSTSVAVTNTLSSATISPTGILIGNTTTTSTGIGLEVYSNTGTAITARSLTNTSILTTHIANVALTATSNTNYAISATANNYYGITGKTNSSTYGGVYGRNVDDTKYGVLGYGTTNSFYGVGDIYTSGAANITGNVVSAYSDKRLKKVVDKLTNALDIICQLNGFKYIENKTAAKVMGRVDESVKVGLFAQDVEKVLPELIRPAPFDFDYQNMVSKSGKDYKTIQYELLIPVLVEAIKQLNDKINKQGKKARK